jgi:hypothetical protein
MILTWKAQAFKPELSKFLFLSEGERIQGHNRQLHFSLSDFYATI